MSTSPPSPADETRSPAFVPTNRASEGEASPAGGATVVPPLPSKEELEREQLRLTNEKLKIETNKLQQGPEPERWWSRLFKNAIAFGGVVTVAASAYGIWDSYNKTILDRERTLADRERTRLADQRIRFEDAIKRLESTSTISKLVGVSLLSGYLDASNKENHRQVLFTLAGLTATEKDSQTQAAVIDLMTAIPKDGPIALADWRYFQDSLVTQSRALMAKGDLWHHRHFGSTSPLTDDERAARTVGRLIALNVRKGVVSDHADYRGIYCGECDFHGAAFPRGVDFTGAVLDRSNFSGATLEASVFDNAELLGTRFVEADLRRAKFRSLDESLASQSGSAGDRTLLSFGRTRYLEHIVSALDINPSVDITMPNFSCANLAEANFDFHSLFPGVIGRRSKSDQLKSGFVRIVLPPKFFKANIAGAHLERARFFTFTDWDGPPDYYLPFSNTVRVGEIGVVQGNIDVKALRLDGEDNNGGHTAPTLPTEVLIFQDRLKATFFSVELDHASLPEHIADFLKKKTVQFRNSDFPERDNFLGTFRSPFGGGRDPDLDCTPRHS